MASGFSAHLEELFAQLGGVSLRRMFGGIGVFRQGMMFGLVADDVLYLKADAATAPRFEAEGCGPFVYEGRGKPVAMPYRRVPDRLYDEPEEFTDWAGEAFAVAVRTAKPKKSKSAKSRTVHPRSNG